MTVECAEGQPGQRAGRREWGALGVLVLPVLLISIDNTVLGFAVPHLSEGLAPSGPQLLWIVDIYSFMLAGLLVTMGTLGDRIGRRRLLLAGAAGFGIASALAAYASSPEMLIAARALLGFAGATLMPSTLSLLRNIFLDQRQRTTAIAVWATMFSVGSALGPVVGGWLLEHYWWGSVFLLNLPVMAVFLVLAPTLVPESKDPNPGRYDLVSAGLSLVAMISAVYGMKSLASHGLGAAGVASLSAGVLLGVLFVRRQRTLDAPLLDIKLFSNRGFSVSVITNMLTMIAFIGALFFITQYLQIVLGLSPMRAAFVLVPGLTLAIFTGLFVVRLMRRGGIGPLLLGALLGVAAGYALMTQLPDTSNRGVWLLAVGFTLVGAGVGAANTITNNTIMSAVGPSKAGAASAISETAYEVGAAMGTAILGTIVTAVYASGLAGVPGISAAGMDEARQTLGGALNVAADVGETAGTALMREAGAAFTSAVHVTSLIGAILVAFAAVQAFLVLRRPVRIRAGAEEPTSSGGRGRA
ncbi:MFS transporter [Phytoactinopolyspora alkaliphila]|uniref:MFS transporter n=1 Tax=Phytoactinopolyspora alkaliphila TaxID=1783498 RepID=A0A6N9YTT3_9ACTN|nr:MFS transporter [Phytoactinopolyspora alkaliphila]NED98340.1 MFS transporter [Phytoactinopolyspora alkaliphila]